MLPGILNQLGAESLTHLKRLASNVTGGAGLGEVAGAGDDDDDEVPDLVENFDEASKDEKATEGASEEAKISEGKFLVFLLRPRRRQNLRMLQSQWVVRFADSAIILCNHCFCFLPQSYFEFYGKINGQILFKMK